MSILSKSLLTNLKLVVQKLPYERIAALPTLDLLGLHIRLDAEGEACDFISDANIEFMPGEVIIQLDRFNPTVLSATVYRRSVRGAITKVSFVNVLNYWATFSDAQNYSSRHYSNLEQKLIDNVLNKEYSEIDIALNIPMLIKLNEMYSLRESDDAQSILRTNRFISIRESLLMALGHDLIHNELVTPVPFKHLDPEAAFAIGKLLQKCPWIDTPTSDDISRAISYGGSAVTHPLIAEHQRYFTLAIMDIADKKHMLTENNIYDATDWVKNVPRYFAYV